MAAIATFTALVLALVWVSPAHSAVHPHAHAHAAPAAASR